MNRFFEVSNFSCGYGSKFNISEVNISLEKGSFTGILGPNGSGKTTIFKMITGELTPQKGKIHIVQGKSIAISRQVVPRDQLPLSIKEFFETAFVEKDYQIDRKIEEVLKAVNFNAPMNKPIKDFSG